MIVKFVKLCHLWDELLLCETMNHFLDRLTYWKSYSSLMSDIREM